MNKSLLIVGLVVASVAVAAGLVLMYNLPFDFREPAPIQPLVFSHRIHAGENGIPCFFCHRYPLKSPVAGIPAVATCVKTCHPAIGLEIRELAAYSNKQEPIPWVRVYVLPDHIYFPHMMHLRAGLACADCHGDVAAQEPLTRSVKLKMGWCLDCHKLKKVGIDCWMCHK